MLARFERRGFEEGCKVWIGKYRGLQNILHWHLENELVFCKEGSATVLIDGKTYLLNSRMGIFIHSESIHNIKASSSSVLIVAQYDNSVCSRTASFMLEKPLFEDKYNGYYRLDKMLKEMQVQKLFYTDKVNSAMAELVVDIFRVEELIVRDKKKPGSVDKYKELLEVIDSSYDYLTFSDAASFVNMSKSNFSRWFKKTFGMSFSKYINIVRVSKAIEIIKENPKITMTLLMMKCGFNTLRNFNRVFKEITGYPPSRLPPDFILNVRSLVAVPFDPTLEDTEQLL